MSDNFVGPTGQQFFSWQGKRLARWADIFLLSFCFPGRCPGLEKPQGLRPTKHRTDTAALM